MELAYDNSIDYPMLWRYLADVITPVILADQFTLSDLKPLILEHLLPVGKAAALLAEILLSTKELKVSTVWVLYDRLNFILVFELLQATDLSLI